MPNKPIRIDAATLDTLMPFHLLLDDKGVIRHVGRSLDKVLEKATLRGRSVFDIFEFRRPSGISSLEDFEAVLGKKVHVHLIKRPIGSVWGIITKLQMGDGYLLNLSLGAKAVTALKSRELLAKDFAPTDASIDMIYLLEVQSAVLAASRGLNTRLHGAKEKAEVQAYTDSLTGLSNRRALQRHIYRLLDAEPYSDFAVILIDLDFFKAVNDTYGHAAGDHVLKEVSNRLLSIARSTDMVARIGGDEFVLVLGNFDDSEALRGLALRLVQRLKSPIHLGQETYQIGASIGAKVVDKNQGRGFTPDILLKSVDKALYKSKEMGRGTVTLLESH